MVSHCDTCVKPGARLTCAGCGCAKYCDRACQALHWKRGGHKQACAKAATTAAAKDASPPAQHPADSPRVSGTTAGVGAVEADEENECPICLTNADDYAGDASDPAKFLLGPGQCFQCGQLICGPCKRSMFVMRRDDTRCPLCRASFDCTGEEQFKRLWNLVHERLPGRHTYTAYLNLAEHYRDGVGVKADAAEALRWCLKAANGTPPEPRAQQNVGYAFLKGDGVPKDAGEA